MKSNTARLYPNGYIMAPKHLYKDERLTPQAIALLIYMSGLPSDWHYSESGLLKVLGKLYGADALSRCLKLLEKCGYLRRQRQREGGRFSPSVWTITVIPERAEEAAGETSGAVKTMPVRSARATECVANTDASDESVSEPCPDTPSAENPPVVKPAGDDASRADVNITPCSSVSQPTTKETDSSSSIPERPMPEGTDSSSSNLPEIVAKEAASLCPDKKDDDEIMPRRYVAGKIPENVDVKKIRIKLSNHYADAFLDAEGKPIYWNTPTTTAFVERICGRVKDKTQLTTDNILKALHICSVYSKRSSAGLAAMIIDSRDYSAADSIKGNPNRKVNRFNNFKSREHDFEAEERELLGW